MLRVFGRFVLPLKVWGLYRSGCFSLIEWDFKPLTIIHCTPLHMQWYILHNAVDYKLQVGVKEDCPIKTLGYFHRKFKHKQINCVPICKIMHCLHLRTATSLNVLLNIWNMRVRFGPSLVISERPYNLEVDLLLRLVGREVCHMFSIHKYWLWLSSWLSLTLVGFHFRTNLYEMCPISPQSLLCAMCTCSA